MQNHEQIFYNIPSDIQLWEAFKAGDDSALSGLMKNYFRPLANYGTKFTKNRTLIEDVIQDLFLEFLEHRTNLSTPISIKNYIFKAFRNNLCRAIKREGFFQNIFDTNDCLECEECIEQTLISDTETTEINQKIKAEMGKLSKRQMEVIHLKYFENFRLEEIAQLMKINKQSVSNLINKSLYFLKTNWKSSLFFSILFN